jgi:hypothetical protein
MAKHNVLDTDTVNLNDIFGNGRRYRVPLYQRDYSWREEQWEDLWTDILAVKNGGAPHYMGAVVFQSDKEKSYGVIDGQQRLVTLSLVALAALKLIKELIESKVEPKQNEERKLLLLSNYIGSKDPVSLHYSSKLSLNENNNSFYQSFLVQLRAPLNRHRLSDSDKLLWQAFEYFYERIVEELGVQADGAALADFMLNCVGEKLLFIRIVVEDELNAYTVFETLNARGLELTTTDLLKNYLLALSSTSELDQKMAKEQWRRIIEITDMDGFPKFLRYYWNSRNTMVGKENLFKTLRRAVTGKEEAFDLLENLEKCTGVYAALGNPNDDFWEGNREIKRRVRELKLFNITQCYPLLLTAYEKFSRADFERILRACVIVSFRYIVIGERNPNVQEKIYCRLACDIFHEKITQVSQIEKAFQEIYLSDEDFKNAFKTKVVNTKRGKKLARYILFSLENQMSSSDRNFEDDPGTIEHILPENPTQEWETSFSYEDQSSYTYRLGNLTLLETKKNSGECQNALYEKKLPIYQTSQYFMTKDIDFPEWTPTQVISRQERLAKTATAVWKLASM